MTWRRNHASSWMGVCAGQQQRPGNVFAHPIDVQRLIPTATSSNRRSPPVPASGPPLSSVARVISHPCHRRLVSRPVLCRPPTTLPNHSKAADVGLFSRHDGLGPLRVSRLFPKGIAYTTRPPDCEFDCASKMDHHKVTKITKQANSDLISVLLLFVLCDFAVNSLSRNQICRRWLATRRPPTTLLNHRKATDGDLFFWQDWVGPFKGSRLSACGITYSMPPADCVFDYASKLDYDKVTKITKQKKLEFNSHLVSS